MAVHSIYLARLNDAQRSDLEKRLRDRQSGRCFLCNIEIDLVLHKGRPSYRPRDSDCQSGSRRSDKLCGSCMLSAISRRVPQI